MSHSLSSLLLMYAQQFEDQHAPQNMTIALRETAKELDRLYAGGCARDQSTTQYCAEAARLAEDNERLRAALSEAGDRNIVFIHKTAALTVERNKLRAALKLWREAYRTGRNEPLAIAWDATNDAALTQEPRT